MYKIIIGELIKNIQKEILPSKLFELVLSVLLCFKTMESQKGMPR